MEMLPVRVHGLDASSQHFCTAAPAHRHNEVELVYARGGDVTLMFNGRAFPMAEGESAVFWAAVPHFSARNREGAALCWVHVPLRQFLDWRLPDNFVKPLMRGKIIRDPAPRATDLFLPQLDKWHGYLRGGAPEPARIVNLEVEALFREVAMHVLARGEREDAGLAGLRDVGRLDRVDRMLRYIADRYHEQITVTDIANAAGLKPGHAMRLFRAAVGETIVGYVNEHRISHSQRMLVTTDSSVLDILLEAGFGSVTQFYTQFKRRCGCAPNEYRAAAR